MSNQDFSEYFNSQARAAASRQAGLTREEVLERRDEADKATTQELTMPIGTELVRQGFVDLKPAGEAALKSAARAAGVSEETIAKAGRVASNLADGNLSRAINSSRANVQARASNAVRQAVAEDAPQLERVTMSLNDIVRDPSLFRQYVRQNKDNYGSLADAPDDAIEQSRQALIERGAGEYPNIQETFMREVPRPAQVGEGSTPGSRVLADATQTRGDVSAPTEASSQAAGNTTREAARTTERTVAKEGEDAIEGEIGEAAADSLAGPIAAIGLGLLTLLGGAADHPRHDPVNNPIVTSGVQFGA